MKVTIAHLSDIHFGGENPQATAGARDWIVENRPDLTLITGDLTREGMPAEFEAARAFIASLPGPVMTLPGNHDTPYLNLLARLVLPWGRWRKHLGDEWKAGWRKPGLSVAAMNTARGAQIRLNWSKGALSHGQTRRALSQMGEASSGDLRIIACHHPLLELAGGPMTGAVRGGRHGARAIAEAGADLVLTGHVHVPFALPLPFGDGRTYAVGASTLSVRERGVPPGFNCITADPECIHVVAMGWAGSHYEPWRTWGLDRRVTDAQKA